ncbi:MAG TPA: ATP-dependent zinc metalloprotease FtsH [Actinomycetota bacterium]|nr:ATP-dependent zinc metalloprotease FtsH [Actinomycetota bacterium]
MLVGIWLFVALANRERPAQDVTFSEFQSAVDAGQVESATFLEGDQRIEGELTDGTRYSTGYPLAIQESLTKEMLQQGVKVDADPQNGSPFLGFLLQLIPVILIVGAFIWIMNQSQGGGGRVMQFGKARAKQVTKDQPKTTFADVAGVDEAIEELQEVKEYLQNPAKFQAMGAKIPRGVLLFGPPGAGKTLLARAVAGEAGVPFYSISGSDFVEMFVGVGAARVRDLFEQAKQNAPAIVFIDEIDAVGRHRGAGLGGGHDEREQTLNQLLVEMDGFDQRTAVILMAATNRPDILDPALLRPGRFDRHVTVDRPDLEGRKAILRVHARGKPWDESVDLAVIARRTPGFTGADLSNVINEAALLAARWSRKAIGMKEIEEAIDRVMAGPERKTRAMSEREKRMIAYHEGGHALVAHILPNTDPVHKISVIPRGRALGYTLTLPEQDKFLATREELIDELAMLLGGRVAEELIVGDITTGAANDIERATKVARQMVTEYGMSDIIGPLTLGQKQHEVFLARDYTAQPDYSDQVAFEIDTEVRRLIDEAHDEALEILQEHRAKLDELAQILVDRETMEREEVEAFLSEIPKRPQRDIAVRGAGLAISRRAVRTPNPPGAPGTIPPKPVG